MIVTQYKSEEMCWGVWKIEESVDELLTMLTQKAWYTAALTRFKLESRKCEWLAVRVLLKHLLQEEKEICYESSGAPKLADGSMHISLSHTKGYVAVQVSKSQSAGIDIEYIASRIQKIQHRIMSETELSHLSTEQPIIHALLHWSAKETLFKAILTPDVDFREHLHIQPFELAAAGMLFANETRTPMHRVFEVGYKVTDVYVLTYIHR
jgi:4'-phosphopantetheinyl transferase EntD